MKQETFEIIKIVLSVAVVITLIFTYNWVKNKLRDEEINDDEDDF